MNNDLLVKMFVGRFQARLVNETKCFVEGYEGT